MYYRRKVLLALIQQFGGLLSKMDLQKYMFLFNKEKEKPDYEFIPYHYGCYSFQLNQDLSTLTKYKIIEASDIYWRVIDKSNYAVQLIPKDKKLVLSIYHRFNKLNGNDLIKYVYENDPYYAINSRIAETLLSSEKYQLVQKYKYKLKKEDYNLFSIGYEGKSIEYYTNQLIHENIKVLCDIRKNPISMKYGFSKNQLKFIIENSGIEYLHIPELGIDSSKRKNLDSQNDYEALFNDYEFSTLTTKELLIEKLSGIFLKNKRIAFTCFESDYKQCHRSRLLKVLSEKVGKEYLVTHL